MTKYINFNEIQLLFMPSTNTRFFEKQKTAVKLVSIGKSKADCDEDYH